MPSQPISDTRPPKSNRAVDSQSLTKEANASEFLDTPPSDLASQNMPAQRSLKGFTKPDETVANDLSSFESELFDASAFDSLRSDDIPNDGEFPDFTDGEPANSSAESASPATVDLTSPASVGPVSVEQSTSSLDATDNSIPDGSWDSSNSRKNRTLILAIVIGLGGLVVAGVAFAVFVSLSNQTDVSDKSNDANPTEATDEKQIAQENLEGDSNDPTSSSNEKSVSNELATNTNGDVANQNDSESTGDSNSESASVKSMAEILDSANDDTDNLAESSVDKNARDNPELNQGEPDDSQSTSAALNALDPLAELTAAVEDNNQSEQNSKLLSQFESIFNPSSAGLLNDVTTENENNIVRPPILDIGETVHPAAIEPLPIDDVLNRPIVAIQTDPIPLSVAVRTLCSLGNVGITVDLFALQAAQIPFDVEIELKATNTTFEELLSQSLAPANLVVVKGADRILTITAKEELLQETVPTTYPLTDLISADVTDQQWQQFLFDGFQIDDNALVIEKGVIQFSNQLGAADRYKILSQIDRIREMTGGVKVLSHEPSDSHPWDLRALAEKAAGTSDDIITHDRPIAFILGQLAQQHKISLWIDWRHTMPHGLAPATMATSLVRNRSLEDVAFGFLDKHSLELLAIDANNLILSTAIARRTSPTWLAVPINPTDDLKEIKLQFAEYAPIDSKYQSQLWIGKVPGQNVALLRLCWPDLSQIADIPDIVRE